MKLKDLDKDYRKISDKDPEEKIEYCEKLISRMRSRLSDDYSDTSHIRALILEMIEAAEEEIAEIKGKKKRK
jgi:hypothetical protein